MNLLQVLDEEIQTVLMMEGNGLKFDTDAFIAGPPDHRLVNEDRGVLSRREDEKIDDHPGGDSHIVSNSTSVPGEIHRSDDMRPVIHDEGTGERGGDSSVTACDHVRHHGPERIAEAMPPGGVAVLHSMKVFRVAEDESGLFLHAGEGNPPL